MEILGRIRAVLEGVDLRGREERLFAVMTRSALGTLGEKIAFSDHAEGQGPRRRTYDQLVAAGIMRVHGNRICPKCGKHHLGAIVRKTEAAHRQALPDLQRTDTTPSELLWGHWLLALGESLGGPANERWLIDGLWERGTRAKTETFHALTSETLLDGFVYDELVTIHAAYNSAKLADDKGMLERVRRAVRWHVENTQPDNTTNEPWALAAFAALDETGTFAEQQLHDTIAWLQNSPPLPNGRLPVAVGLLADAAMTLQNR